MNKIILITLVAAIASAFTGAMVGKNWTKFPPPQVVETTADQTPPPVAVAAAKPAVTPQPTTRRSTPRATASPLPAAGRQPTPARSTPSPVPPVKPGVAVTTPAARQALARVGSDPAAQALWTQAINDASISSADRRNLIEDLNEEGFADLQNLTAADLAIIESRLAMLEQLAPDAMDETNAAAFDEAYNNLMDMRATLVDEN